MLGLQKCRLLAGILGGYTKCGHDGEGAVTPLAVTITQIVVWINCQQSGGCGSDTTMATRALAPILIQRM
jgi:hypothetical protein